MNRKMNISGDNIPGDNVNKAKTINMNNIISKSKINGTPTNGEQSTIQGSTSDNIRNSCEDANQRAEPEGQTAFNKNELFKDLQLLNMLMGNKVSGSMFTIEGQNVSKDQLKILLEKSLIKSIAKSFVQQIFTNMDYNELFKEILSEYVLQNSSSVSTTRDNYFSGFSCTPKNNVEPSVNSRNRQEINPKNLNKISDRHKISRTFEVALKSKTSESKKIKINYCLHKNEPHYAKNMCKNCYFKQGRKKKALSCNHPDQPLYALGMCKQCYQSLYSKQRKRKRRNVSTKLFPEYEMNNSNKFKSNNNDDFMMNEESVKTMNFKNNLVENFLNDSNRNMSGNLMGDFDFLESERYLNRDNLNVKENSNSTISNYSNFVDFL